MNAQSYVFISVERKEKNSGTFEQYCALPPRSTEAFFSFSSWKGKRPSSFFLTSHISEQNEIF